MVSSERLIEIVKKYPELYDPVHPDYGDGAIKAKIWDKIGQIFRTDGGTVEEVWTNLKTSYLRHMKETNRSKVQLTRGYSYLHWVKTMEFFKSYLQFAASLEANIPMPCRDFEPLLGNSDSSDISTTFSEELLQKPKLRKKKDIQKNTPPKSAPAALSQARLKPEMTKANLPGKKAIEYKSKDGGRTDLSVSTSKNISSFIPAPQPLINDHKRKPSVDDYFSNQTITLDGSLRRYYIDSGSLRNVSMDAMELIFLGYAKTVKSFTPIRQTYTKMKIAQIIMEQEIQHLDEGANSSLTAQSAEGDKNPNNFNPDNSSPEKLSNEKRPKRYNDIIELL